jgi:hypothetical protein
VLVLPCVAATHSTSGTPLISLPDLYIVCFANHLLNARVLFLFAPFDVSPSGANKRADKQCDDEAGQSQKTQQQRGEAGVVHDDDRLFDLLGAA